MLPSSIRCESCYLAYNFPSPSAGLYLYVLKYDKANRMVKDDDLLFIPLKPIWCGVCNKPAFAEDFRTLKDWEDAFALAKSGKEIKFPIDTGLYEDKRAVIDALKIWFNIRKQRRDKGRCLFCGGFQYIALDGPNTRLRHECCGGQFTKIYSIYSANYRLSAYRIYDVDGFLIGKLKEINEVKATIYITECEYD